MRLIENECIVDGYGPHLMPTFSKNLLFQKRSLKPTNFEHFKNIFFISGSNFIGLFNGTLFVFIISVVADTQKETFLPVRFNWPPRAQWSETLEEGVH